MYSCNNLIFFLSCCNVASWLLLGTQLSHTSEGTSCNVSFLKKCCVDSLTHALDMHGSHDVHVVPFCYHKRESLYKLGSIAVVPPVSAFKMLNITSSLVLCTLIYVVSILYFYFRKFNHICEQTRFKSWMSRAVCSFAQVSNVDTWASLQNYLKFCPL